MGGLEGRHVVVTGGAGALGQAVTRRLESAGATCHVPVIEETDLTDEAAVVAWYGALPGLWASIHLAGGFAAAAIEETSLAAFRAQVDLNAVTCFLCCREAVKRLRAGGGGRIVNVAARPAIFPAQGAGMIAYTAGKSAVAALTVALAEEVKEHGILVNAVVPSIMDTAANRRAMPKADHARWPRTEEVAEAIAFLVSPENALTSGALVPVYGRS